MRKKDKEKIWFLRSTPRTFILICSGIILLVWFAYFYTGTYISKAVSLLRIEKIKKARQELQAARNLFFRKGEINEIDGILYLLQGKHKKSEQHLKKALEAGSGETSIDSDKIFEKLLSKGDYRGILDYYDYLAEKGINSKAHLYYRICALNGLKRFKEVLELSLDLPAREKFTRQLDLARKRQETGAVPVFYDKSGRSIAYHDINTSDIQAGEPEYSHLFEGKTSLEEQIPKHYLRNKIKLTFNSNIQKIAYNVLGDYGGSIVVVDTDTGNILAAVSKQSINSEKKYPNKAFYKQYYPASIIKLLLWDAAMKGLDGSIFPVNCIGEMKAGEEILYCWKNHKTLDSFKQALVESCNIVFAEAALKLGSKRMVKELNLFRFNQDISTNFVILKPGTYEKVKLTDYELSRRAIGHDNITVTPIHAALIAQSIATGGSMKRPKIVKNISNILDKTFVESDSSDFGMVITDERAQKIRSAMTDVIESPEGTGKRAKIPDFKYGVKTGTARNSDGHLNALIAGFAPAGKPDIAFSIFLENAGKSEYEGARTVKKFIKKLREKNYFSQ